MDPNNATAWYKNIKSVNCETPGPLSVGSQITFTAKFLGRSLIYTYEVRDLVPEERFTQSTAEGPFPMETTYHWESLPSGGTRMSLRNRGEPSGFSKANGTPTQWGDEESEPKRPCPPQDHFGARRPIARPRRQWHGDWNRSVCSALFTYRRSEPSHEANQVSRCA